MTLPMVQVGGLELWEGLFVLKTQGVNQAGQRAMGDGAVDGAVLKRSIPDNHVGTNHSLRRIVVRGKTGDIEKRENFVFVLEHALRQTLPIFIGVGVGPKFNKAFVDEPNAAFVDEGSELGALSAQAQGIG